MQFFRPYIGRFAPSPSGPLHAGSLVAAMASFLDARAHQGRWLLRIEDIDTPRTVAGADRLICQQLRALGMVWDDTPVWQSRRQPLYEQAFEALRAAGRVYGCSCTRRELPPGPYPGTCRPAAPPADQGGTRARPRPIRAWRFRVEPGVESFHDRWLGPQAQDVLAEVGDFIIRRADGLWAYQLAVVVDDGAQGITDIVRGVDLLDSTARQRQLARTLGLPCPRVMHVPLVRDASGRKLSKQNHAPGLTLDRPLPCLQQAWQALGFESLQVNSVAGFWSRATEAWGQRHAKRAAVRTDHGPHREAPV